MKNIVIFLIPLLFLNLISNGQGIYKPKGCSASTGPNVSTLVLQHAQDRYHLITMEWSDIEPSPGVFSFTALQSQINTVKSYNKKYALAIVSGGTGSPAWLIDSLKVAYIEYLFRGTTPLKLPLWWDPIVQQHISNMVTALGNKFANDTSLALVYVTQMSANGIEGHLNGIDMSIMYKNGFTPINWINSAKQTACYYATAFPDKAIAFEVHEIDNTANIPSIIINDLYNDITLCQRVGAAIWWLSGKTSYQTDLLTTLQNFQGDKYAQLIGKSSEASRFENDTIATAFTQAKQLGVRYIESWYFEYQNSTINDLLADFNNWSEIKFSSYANCQSSTGIFEKNTKKLVSIYPNPATDFLILDLATKPNDEIQIQIFNTMGILIKEKVIYKSGQINISELISGFYFIRLKDNPHQILNFIKQ